MKKLIVTFALCALPILPAAAGLPWTEQMTAAVTPEELKADRFVAFRKAASGMLELISAIPCFSSIPEALKSR